MLGLVYVEPLRLVVVSPEVNLKKTWNKVIRSNQKGFGKKGKSARIYKDINAWTPLTRNHPNHANMDNKC